MDDVSYQRLPSDGSFPRPLYQQSCAPRLVVCCVLVLLASLSVVCVVAWLAEHRFDHHFTKLECLNTSMPMQLADKPDGKSWLEIVGTVGGGFGVISTFLFYLSRCLGAVQKLVMKGQEIREALDDRPADTSGLLDPPRILILGDTGVGKTTLLTELLTEASEGECQNVSGNTKSVEEYYLSPCDTDVGESTLLSELLIEASEGEYQNVSGNTKSVEKYYHSGVKAEFIDTPGFGDSDQPFSGVLKNIANVLGDGKLSAVVLVIDATTPRIVHLKVQLAALKHAFKSDLDRLQEFICVVGTRFDYLSDDEIDQGIDEVRRIADEVKKHLILKDRIPPGNMLCKAKGNIFPIVRFFEQWTADVLRVSPALYFHTVRNDDYVEALDAATRMRSGHLQVRNDDYVEALDAAAFGNNRRKIMRRLLCYLCGLFLSMACSYPWQLVLNMYSSGIVRFD
jgi:GTP-binding protein EngB required for normal cell division